MPAGAAEPVDVLSREGGVRELRFHLLAAQPRVTYWLAPGQRMILLTVVPTGSRRRRAYHSAAGADLSRA